MKTSEIHAMSTEELEKKLADLKKDLFNLRLNHAKGQLPNNMTLASCKKDIARVKTVLRERELGISRKA